MSKSKPRLPARLQATASTTSDKNKKVDNRVLTGRKKAHPRPMTSVVTVHSQNGPECPAKGKKCLSCGKPNHFRSVCQSSRNKAANELQDEVCSAQAWDHDDTPLYLGDVHIQDTQPWTVSLVINNSKITFKVDSGADITCLPEAEYFRMRPRPGLEHK